MLSEKYNGRVTFLRETPAPGEAASELGVILTSDFSFHRTDEKTTCEGELLVCDEEKRPWGVTLLYDGEKWSVEKKNLSDELGEMGDEFEFASGQEFVSEDEALKILNKQKQVKKARRKAPHLRLVSSTFTIFDEEFEKPTWRFTLKNWPLINYVKAKEETRTVEAVIDALNGKVLGCREYH